MSKRILIVDDEPDICELFSFEFEADGFETYTAGNAREAITLLEKQTVDAILSDIRMPGGTGIELLTWVRQNLPLSVVFVLMTGYSDISLDKAFQMGAHGIFHKPLKMDEVMVFIDRCIGSPTDSGPAKRRSSRLATKLDACFWGTEDGEKSQAIVRDISRGGMRLSTESRPPQDFSIISFTLALPGNGGPLIEGTAEVRWQTSTADALGHHQFGVEFQTLAPSAFEALFAFLTASGITPLVGLAPAKS